MFARRICAVALCSCALVSGGCATDSASKEDVVSLRNDVTQLAQRQAALQQKIEELDARVLVITRRLSPATHGDATPVPSSAPSGIPVVKLGPTTAALPVRAPPLPTEVALREPTADEVEALETAAPKASPDDVVDTHDFDAAVETVSTGDVERGIAQLEAFVKANPRHPKADNALLLIAVARLQSGDPEAALAPLQRVLRDYPAGDAVPETLLRLGECQLKLKNVAAARSALARLVSDFPGSPLAREAEIRLAAMPEIGGSAARPRAARTPAGH